jgi:Co/Zn/Cd efflux system component
MVNVFVLIVLCISMLLFGNLSHRIGIMTQVPPYYRWFYISALLFAITAVFRLFFITGYLENFDNNIQNSLYTLIGDGIPSIAITIALVVAWYYWSWLLGERD